MNTLKKLIEAGVYQEGKPLKLHLGCGTSYLDGYLNIDYEQAKHSVMQVKVDATADITKDLNFPENSVDEIRLHHVFEHFNRVEALVQLIKWHKWLKLNGNLIIETPDFEYSIRQILNPTSTHSLKMAIIRHLTGDQSDNWAYHVDQWYEERFISTLSALGFSVLDVETTKWEVWPHLSNITIFANKQEERSFEQNISISLDILKDSMVSEKEYKTYNIWMKQLKDSLEGF